MGLTHTARKMFQTDHYRLREGQKKVGQLARQNVILVGECGSGKTEAAYFWLGDSQKRAVYVMPRRVLATQTQERLNLYDRYVYGRSRWSIQHSSAREDEQFGSPQVVTTIDQVAAKYLALGRFDAIGGGRLMQSDLIVDEVQLLEGEKTLQLLINLLEETTQLGNHFLMMTATIPDSLIHFFEDRFDCTVVKIKQTIHTNQENTLDVVDDFPMRDINHFTKKQIVLVNSQKEQDVIMSQITDPSRVIVLNSYLLPSERALRETEVYTYFGKDTPENDKILLSTQIIEAGMDISAGRMTTSIAPMDSLIQRAGRLNRWGGKGLFRVVRQAFHNIYDDELIRLTGQVLDSLQHKRFDWETHLEAVNTVMNDYYAKLVLPRRRKSYAMQMKQGGRTTLIRDIDQVNVIVTDSFTTDDFKRESVSISLYRLREAKPKLTYRLEKGRLEAVPLQEVSVGDTLLIDGEGFHYNRLGLLLDPAKTAQPFPMQATGNATNGYDDYIEETWLTHANAVKDAAMKRLVRDQFLTPARMQAIPLWNGYTEPDSKEALYKDLSHIIGLHDVGKLTTNWQRFIGKTNEPLAHRPWQPRSAHGIKDLKHNVLSMHALSGDVSLFSQNLLLQHHGRTFLNRSKLAIKPCTFDPQTPKVLADYQFQGRVLTKVESGSIGEGQLITPGMDGWGVFLYALGICMEADIKGIQNVKRYVLKAS